MLFRSRVPALLDGQFAARRAEAVDRQQRRYARPGYIGCFMIDVLLKEAIQFESLPKIQAEKAGAECSRTFQAHLVQ